MRRTGGSRLGWLGLIGLCLPLALATAEAPAPVTTPAAPPDQGSYVVKKGDTLSGIAKALFNDPSLWQRIWEVNPFIKDPNRIFPGDRLALPGREFRPAPVAEAPKPAPPKEPPKEKEEAKAPPPPAAPPAKAEEEFAPLPPVPPASEQALACSPVVAPEKTTAGAGIGTIVRNKDNRLLLSQEDNVLVSFDGASTAKVGDRLAVIRTGFRVIHPRTRRSQGRVLFTLGVLETTEVLDRMIRARVIFGCEAMSIGDRVALFAVPPFPMDKIARPATRRVEGTLLDSPRKAQTYALTQLVFLDVGVGQGIGPGDIFAIWRPSAAGVHPQTAAPLPISQERLGEVVVIRVTEGTSTAVVTASSKESQAGDRVVLSRQVQP